MSRIEADAFDVIALGETSPAEAMTTIRKWSREQDEAFGRYVYVALKAVTLRLLTTRARSEVSAWHDVIRQSSALLKKRGDTVHGERLLAVSDLAADWERICAAHPVKEVLARPYVLPILEALYEHGGSAKRATIAKALNIGEANFSRILNTLEEVGLLLRDKRREKTLALTAEGRAQVEARQDKVEDWEFETSEDEEPALEDFRFHPFDGDTESLQSNCVVMEVKGTTSVGYAWDTRKTEKPRRSTYFPPLGKSYRSVPATDRQHEVHLVPEVGTRFVTHASVIEALIGGKDHHHGYHLVRADSLGKIVRGAPDAGGKGAARGVNTREIMAAARREEERKARHKRDKADKRS